jgi:hypothetical protein
MAKAICSISECDRTTVGRGWCNLHWLRWKTHGDPLGGGPSHIGLAIDHPDGTRTCSKCSQRVPLSEFGKVKSATLGRRSDCNTCRSLAMSARYAANKEAKKLASRELRKANLEAAREYDRQRYVRDIEKRRAVSSVTSARRRARVAQVRFDAGVTRANLREQYGDHCFYCQATMTFVRVPKREKRPANLATIEHIEPIALSGTHTWDNVVLACLACNCSKRGSTYAEWKRRGFCST